MTGQTTLEQTKTTIDEPDFIAGYRRKAEIYFLGTANRGVRKPLTRYAHLPFLFYATTNLTSGLEQYFSTPVILAPTL